MEKRTLKHEVIGEETWDLERVFNDSDTDIIPIDDLLVYLNKAKEAGSTFVEFNFDYEWDSHNVTDITLQPVKFELESDEVFNERVEANEKHQRVLREFNLAGERRMYEELKKKFGGKDEV